MKDGKYHGKNGFYKFSNGCSYIGDWNMNKFDGKGMISCEDSSFYRGWFKDGKKHG